MYKLMKEFDVVIATSLAGDHLVIPNLIGNPCVVVPKGFNSTGHPTTRPASVSRVTCRERPVCLGLQKMYQEQWNLRSCIPRNLKRHAPGM
jgi:hypothetical protein